MYSSKILQRFWNKVDKTKTCWIWTAAKNPKGYGRFSINSKLCHAHRISYEINYGEIGQDLLVCHRCDNPQCVNPEHLFIGTKGDNMKDAQIKGRAFVPEARRGSLNGNAIFKDLEISQIRSSQESNVTLANRFKTSRQTIWRIRAKKSWKHV